MADDTAAAGETTMPSTLETHYEIAGRDTGPAVVLCHSLGTGLELWDSQVDALSKDFRVLRYDIRGHGKSPATPGDYSMALLVRDLIGLLDLLSLEKVAFCGVSLGAMIGLQLAIDAPDRVTRLVLAGASAHMDNTDLWQQRVIDVRRDGTAPIVEELLKRWFMDDFAIRHRETVERFATIARATDAQGYAGCTAAIRDFDVRERLKDVSARTLILSGEDDIATPQSYASALADSIPDSSHQVVAAAGHLANIEQPEIFNRLVTTFLTSTT